jgi:hypothetical protein
VKKNAKPKPLAKNERANVGGEETDGREEESVDKREFAGLRWENYSTASII